jgi:hypothetical protein
MHTLIKRTVLLLALVWLSACSKLTPENFNKIKSGMEYAQVVEILGEPSRCDSLLIAKSCIWGDDKKKIDVKFVSDKVVLTTSTGL